ncbi:CHAD domain-containing protein [Metallosphaera tengchongensis]|uniref:CHAD domain-containing protein n=1 Tax=Metallosphaera tengchongensis TaxID=1532350 RepID=A0A6N0NXD7_9CREN|nr:CHAD domain-containing protein [Metallosphaera tengchongensis]
MIRPEDYANEHLGNFLEIIGFSQESVHDARVELRRFYVVAKALYPLHGDYGLIDLTRGLLKDLGKVRDMDVHGCPKIDRDKVVAKTLRLSGFLTRLPKLYGSRYLVAQNLLSAFFQAREATDFHQLRKVLREARFLSESLGIEAYSLKEVVKEMGEMRDNVRRSLCEGVQSSLQFDESLKERGVSAVRELLLSDHEFHHIKARILNPRG